MSNTLEFNNEDLEFINNKEVKINKVKNGYVLYILNETFIAKTGKEVLNILNKEFILEANDE